MTSGTSAKKFQSEQGTSAKASESDEEPEICDGGGMEAAAPENTMRSSAFFRKHINTRSRTLRSISFGVQSELLS